MKKIFAKVAVAVAIIVAFASVSFAWLSDNDTVKLPTSFGGSTKAAYFAGGDGSSADDAYKISNEVHMYNLAWLQYIGYFNYNGGETGVNNGLKQSYFELTADIDMSLLGSALPPIGTEEYPFIGNFNGNGHTISGLTVSNTKGDGNITKYPTNARFDANGMLDCADNSSKEVQIVGAFGVVGNYNKVVGYTLNDTLMNVKGFYLDGITVKTYSENTLVGLVAGEVSASLSNVGVGKSQINLSSSSVGLGDNGNVVSKYSIVGDYDAESVGWTTKPTGGGWGGSIDMKGLHTRLKTFRNSTPINYVDANYNDSSSGAIRFYDENKGSVYFRSQSLSQNQLFYLYGGKITAGYIEDTSTQQGFFIRSGTNYLTVNNLSTNGARVATTDISKAVTWYYNENEKSLYTYSDNQIFYLNVNSYGAINLLTTQMVSWTKNGNQISAVVSYGTKNYTYYLTYSSQWGGNMTAQNLQFDETYIYRSYSPSYLYSGEVTNSNNNKENRNFATYLPLNVDDDYNVVSNNTGYIASGSTTIESNQVAGDIRVNNSLISSNLKTSLNNASTFGDGTTLELLTRNKKSNGFVRISDNYNANNNSVSSTIGSYTKMTVSALGLKSYTDSRQSLNNIMLDASNVYGMHFMNAQINEKNIYVADKAVINGDTFYNYEMLANSIDFKVKQKGIINFFAGTYYSGNNNFFSLHQVLRNKTDNTISEVKEIWKIYSNKNNSELPYIYMYADGTYSQNITSDYELEFDCDWITNPVMVMNTVYYFEIPVNADEEYALGSASTGDGAYLMYLDIGAHGNSEPGTEKTLNINNVEFVNDTLGNADFPEHTTITVELTSQSAASFAQYLRTAGTTYTSDGKKIDTHLQYYISNISYKLLPDGYGDEKTSVIF